MVYGSAYEVPFLAGVLILVAAGRVRVVEETDNAHRRLVELFNRGELSGVLVRIEQQWTDYQARHRRVQELKRLFRLD